ncbi:hypothetical protein IFM89_014580 [Coptis chinensis]|uniref:Secoisolariciresinol dehydrogenase n=1 Tax=Coptis chinensis TaxID=261450 RepID=A0A835GWI7_9MAGN|nr:hypothetical protein IFM89_014580 [Coptis chinensis]
MGTSAIFSAIPRRGIGECTAKLFSKHGAKVVIADIQDDLGRSVSNEIGTASATYVHCDVTNETQVQYAVDTTVTKYGKLDIMFNNAGIGDPFKPRIVDNEKADFEKVLSVNVTGVFLCTKHAARVMIPARNGSIISSASAVSVVGGAASHAYTCSKHAVAGLTKNAALELGQFGIRVNCLSPYGSATPSTLKFFKVDNAEPVEQMFESFGNLKGVIHKAEDVAQAALYLGSDDSKYVSGHNLLIDGGFTVGNPSFAIFKQLLSSSSSSALTIAPTKRDRKDREKRLIHKVILLLAPLKDLVVSFATARFESGILTLQRIVEADDTVHSGGADFVGSFPAASMKTRDMSLFHLEKKKRCSALKLVLPPVTFMA